MLRILPLVSEVTSLQNANSNNITGGSVDYDSGPYDVTFPAGETSVMFGIPINDDAILEDDEDFTITIRSGSLPNRVTRGGPNQATVTIVDDEGKNF